MVADFPHLRVRKFFPRCAISGHGLSNGDLCQIRKGAPHLSRHFLQGNTLGGKRGKSGIFRHAETRAEPRGHGSQFLKEFSVH